MHTAENIEGQHRHVWDGRFYKKIEKIRALLIPIFIFLFLEFYIENNKSEIKSRKQDLIILLFFINSFTKL